MKQLFIIHGAIKRKSTFLWTQQLADYFTAQHYKCHCFYWTGIPLQFFVSQARDKFIKFYESHVDVDCEQYIYAKSMGADIVNAAYCFLRNAPKRVIFNSPAFSISNSIAVSGENLLNINLANDKFVSRWEKFGIVNRLPLPGSVITVDNDSSFDHHQMNWNSEVKIIGNGELYLYELYKSWLSGNYRDPVKT